MNKTSYFLSALTERMVARLLLGVFLLFTIFSANAITYQQIRELKNPYDVELEKLDESASVDYILTLDAKSRRFDLCHDIGLVAFSNMVFAVPLWLEQKQTKNYIFELKAGNFGVDYPFATNNLDTNVLVVQLALNLGWKYQAQHYEQKGYAEKVVPLFWDECTTMPLKPFEDELRE